MSCSSAPRAWRGGSARAGRCATCRSTCTRARRSRSSGRTARASRPCSPCWPGRSSRAPAAWRAVVRRATCRSARPSTPKLTPRENVRLFARLAGLADPAARGRGGAAPEPASSRSPTTGRPRSRSASASASTSRSACWAILRWCCWTSRRRASTRASAPCSGGCCARSPTVGGAVVFTTQNVEEVQPARRSPAGAARGAGRARGHGGGVRGACRLGRGRLRGGVRPLPRPRGRRHAARVSGGGP